MKLINGFFYGALSLLTLSGCGGGGSSDTSSNTSPSQTSQRILNQGIVPNTSDGVYFVSNVESFFSSSRIGSSQSIGAIENTGVDHVFVDFGTNQISVAFSDYNELEREDEFFFEPLVFRQNGFGDFDEVTNDLYGFELIAANSDGLVLERTSSASGVNTTVRYTVDYERVADDYRDFVSDLNQTAPLLDLNQDIAVKRGDKGLFLYTNTTQQGQLLQVSVNGVESGATGSTLISAFFNQSPSQYPGELGFIDGFELDAVNNNGETIAFVPAGDSIYVTYDFTDYDPADSLSSAESLRFYARQSFNLRFTALN